MISRIFERLKLVFTRQSTSETWTGLAAVALLLAVLAYAGWFRAFIQAGLFGAAVMLLSLLIVLFLAAALWPAAWQLLNQVLYGDPYWIRPREFDAEDAPAKTRALSSRLDLIEIDQAALLWMDRENGQYWISRRFDLGQAEATLYKPLKSRSDWRGMADDVWTAALF